MSQRMVRMAYRQDLKVVLLRIARIHESVPPRLSLAQLKHIGRSRLVAR
jgi:hypothetical protein